MQPPRIVPLGFLFLFALSAGCAHHAPSGPASFDGDAPQPPPETAPALTTSSPNSDPFSAEALAQKVASYRRDVERQLNKANAAADQPAPTIPANPRQTQPVAAYSRWAIEDSSRITTFPQESDSRRRPVVRPDVAEAAPAPALPQGPASGANFPLSLPESADQPDATPEAQNASATAGPVMTADQIDHRLAAHLRDDPQDLQGQLDYELLLFIEGQPVPQMSAVSQLRSEDREVLSAIMDGLTNFRSVVSADNNALLATKTQPLIDMADRLRTQSELTLTSVSLCSDVKSYGVYTPVDAGWFKAGKDTDTQVIVYCQVQNFQSRLSPEGQWQTQLSQDMTLYTEAGDAVWPDHPQPQRVIDQCRQKRHDFFIARLVALPHSLPAGRYLLKITVTDQQANKVAEATTPLQIN